MPIVNLQSAIVNGHDGLLLPARARVRGDDRRNQAGVSSPCPALSSRASTRAIKQRRRCFGESRRRTRPSWIRHGVSSTTPTALRPRRRAPTRRSSLPALTFLPLRTVPGRRPSPSSLPRSCIRFPGRHGREEAGADIQASLAVPFVDAMRGSRRQVVVTRQEVCAACNGRGSVRTVESQCAACQATGRIRWARGHMVFSKTCATCGGTGQRHQQRCDICAAQGRVVRSEAAIVDVPPGSVEGLRLRVPEKGHAGRNGGRTGDLYVTIHVEPHKLYRREGEDLHLRIPLAVHEAVLGTRIDVPSLDGPVKLRIPPGAQAGQHFRLRGRGVPDGGGNAGRFDCRGDARAAGGRRRTIEGADARVRPSEQ